MEYRVNDLCIGCGLCAGLCPEVFELGEDGLAKAIGEPVDAESASLAKDSCPVGAIESE